MSAPRYVIYSANGAAKGTQPSFVGWVSVEREIHQLAAPSSDSLPPSPWVSARVRKNQNASFCAGWVSADPRFHRMPTAVTYQNRARVPAARSLKK